MPDKIIEASWNPAQSLLNIRLAGIITNSDLEHWQRVIERAIDNITENTHFKLLLDERGYQFENIDVHKKKREIIPLFTYHYGHILNVLSDDDVEILTAITTSNPKKLHCNAVCMVHHDEVKMTELNKHFGSAKELYTHDFEYAQQWLNKLPGDG